MKLTISPKNCVLLEDLAEYMESDATAAVNFVLKKTCKKVLQGLIAWDVPLDSASPSEEQMGAGRSLEEQIGASRRSVASFHASQDSPGFPQEVPELDRQSIESMFK